MQQSTSSLKLRNKFDILQSGQDSSVPTINAVAAQDPTLAAIVSGPDMNVKKISELNTYISKLETTISQLNRAKNAWTEKEKKLEKDNAELSLKYTTLELTSSRNTADLQHQINELRKSLSKHEDAASDDNAAKKRRFNGQQASTLSNSNSLSPSPIGLSADLSSTSQPITPMITDQVQPPPKTDRPPPISVYGVTNYAAFAKFLKSQQVHECTCKETSNSLILNTKDADQYRKLHSVLRQECQDKTGADTFGILQLHSYQLKSERSFVVYIRGLPSTMDLSEVNTALAEKQFTPRRVVNVPSRFNGTLKPHPLFRVDLEPSDQNPEIYNLTNLLQVRIKVEPAKKRTDPPHCRNCQRFGHTKQYCLRTARCIKCGADHPSSACTLDSKAPCTCANCGESHPASYRGCSQLKQLTKQQHKATDEIRRRHAELKANKQTSSASNTVAVVNHVPTSSNQAKNTYAAAALQQQAPATPPPSQDSTFTKMFDVLAKLTNQLARLDQRLSSLEQAVLPEGTAWEKVKGRHSRHRNG